MQDNQGVSAEADRAAAADAVEPVSAVSSKASIPNAEFAYADCRNCCGQGYLYIRGPEAGEAGIASCGNCQARRECEGLTYEPNDTWCVWSKNGRRPTAFHASRDLAEREARRLARKVPGSKFHVLHMVSKWSAASAIKARSGETGTEEAGDA